MLTKRRNNFMERRFVKSKRRFLNTLKDNTVLKTCFRLVKKKINDCDVFPLLVLQYCNFFVPLPP